MPKLKPGNRDPFISGAKDDLPFQAMKHRIREDWISVQHAQAFKILLKLEYGQSSPRLLRLRRTSGRLHGAHSAAGKVSSLAANTKSWVALTGSPLPLQAMRLLPCSDLHLAQLVL